MDMTEKRYPYPVLSPNGDDYVPPSRFDVRVEVEETPDSVTLRFAPILHDDGLRRLIAVEHRARIVCHVESPQTVFRTVCEITPPACDEAAESEIQTVTFDSADLSGRVSVCPFIVASTDIPDYANPSFNPDYENEAFFVSEGAVLAEGMQQTFNVDTARHALEPASSIFVVTLARDESVKSMRVSWNDEKIHILLTQETFQHFKIFHQSRTKREELMAMIYMPALLRVLDELRGYSDGIPEEIAGRRWCRSLDAALKRLQGWGLDSEEFADEGTDTVELAELLLRNALDAALRKIMNQATTITEEDCA